MKKLTYDKKSIKKIPELLLEGLFKRKKNKGFIKSIFPFYDIHNYTVLS